jgi:beta-lactam-binding protein with PASTA domain
MQYAQIPSAISTKWTISKGNSQYSDKVPAGAIVSQIPIAGMKEKPNTSISVTVSLGQNMKPVPDDVGKQQSDTYIDLINAGFLPSAQTKNDENIPVNTVISMDPAGGTQAVSGSTVTYVYSIGPLITMKDIPNLVGATFDNGKTTNALLNAGLKMGKVTHSWNNTVLLGKIVSTSPAFGTQSPQDTAVNIVVSNGKEPANYQGHLLSETIKYFSSNGYTAANGFTIKITDELTGGDIPSTIDDAAAANYQDVVQTDSAATMEIDITAVPKFVADNYFKRNDTLSNVFGGLLPKKYSNIKVFIVGSPTPVAYDSSTMANYIVQDIKVSSGNQYPSHTDEIDIDVKTH